MPNETSEPLAADTKSRYHHGDLASALVAAGMEITRTGGPDALTLREVTRRAGVSPNAAYRHFDSRQALLAAVSRAIESAMAQRMIADGTFGDRAGSQLLQAVGMGYIKFALDEPGWFAVSFFGASSADAPVDVESSPAYLALMHALDQMVAGGELASDARVEAQWPCWAAVHGFAELALRGPLVGQPRATVLATAQRTVDAMVIGICS